jgi:hypothetical protein
VLVGVAVRASYFAEAEPTTELATVDSTVPVNPYMVYR